MAKQSKTKYVRLEVKYEISFDDFGAASDYCFFALTALKYAVALSSINGKHLVTVFHREIPSSPSKPLE